MSEQWGFETRQIHAGAEPDPTTGARAVPIYQTTSYDLGDTQRAANLFALAEIGNVYTADHEPDAGRAGGVASTPSRAAARRRSGCPARWPSAPARRHRRWPSSTSAAPAPTSCRRRRSTAAPTTCFHYTFPKLGIEVTFVDDPDDLGQWRAAVKDNTVAFFGETIPNPKNDVFDIEGVAGVAHDAGVPLIMDNTVPSPYLIRPIEWGADIVVHSLTKFLGGHGNSIGGAITDSGTFDYSASGRFPGFTEPDPSYHGLAFWPALGAGSYILKARVQLLRDIGAPISPFNAFLILQGIETLSLRMERHFENAQKVADYLTGQGQVLSVNYAGLPSSKWHERATKLGAGKGYGSVLAFQIEGGLEAGKKFVEALELHSHVANIGDVRSLVIHPASTTHSQLTPEEQLASDVDPGLVRLSVGLESIEDILADLDKGFAAAKA